jgi:glycerol transport system ATP-binding protein
MRGITMAKVELKSIYHSYSLPSKEASKMSIPDDCVGTEGFVIEDLNLVWENGTANALLGPSGCGKTTVLSIISGLLVPSSGEILFNGKNVTAFSPIERRVAQVFQFPVVYDIMNVYKNLAFPLENLGMSKSDIRKRIETISHILDLDDLLDAPTASLSPTEKQKVSLGRGIVREDTAAILLDEPLTVIDPKERWDLRRKLRQVQKELNITMIYVTHDQHEALTFADRVSVIKDGRLIQTGSPEELHAEPQTPFMGYFIGTPGMNLIDCVLTEKGLETRGLNIVISDALRSRFSGSGKKKVQLGIRPEFVQISKERKDGWLPFQVDAIEKMGAYMNLTLRYRDLEIKARAQEEVIVTENEEIWVNFPEDKSKVFQGDTRLF